ncbi:MAG: type III pantothenate kinase [Nevskia sp.]|nr:type III pantothenate kinase [Nevskia sp.]
MNLLLLDVGNSRLKWAQSQGGTLRYGGAVEHGGDPAAALAAVDATDVDSIQVANVTGAALAAPLAAALQSRFGVAPRFARTEAEWAGLRVAYADPQRLGIDRWLALLAAWTEVRGPLCVASAGTALTFDAVDASGRHLGGVIAPGLTTMQQAVLGATRFAASGPDQRYTEELGDDTDSCVRQGALHACAGLVERLAARYGGSALLLLTGGDAARLLPHLCGGWSERPHLVMEGLLTLAPHTTAPDSG